MDVDRPCQISRAHGPNRVILSPVVGTRDESGSTSGSEFGSITASPLGSEDYFGDVEAIRQLASKFETTGDDLDDIVARLKEKVSTLVPNNWSGEAAQAFKKKAEAEFEVATHAAETAHQRQATFERLADGLEEAKQQYDAAEKEAEDNGLGIQEQLFVYVRVPATGLAELKQAWAHARAQQSVFNAREAADEARRQARGDLADNWYDWVKAKLGSVPGALVAILLGGGLLGMVRSSRVGGKKGATDIPSWAKGTAPRQGESGKDYAKRLMDEKYGEGKYPTGPRSEYNKLKKYGDRHFK